MLFSIIVPVYNVEEYLPACVESVLSQSFDDWELLLVDDGSPDGCGALCDAFAAGDGRIRAFHKPNGGLSDARNFGVAEARGEWVLFLDSDDLLLPGALQNFAALTGESIDLMIGKVVHLFSDGVVRREEWSGEGLPAGSAAESFAALLDRSGATLWEAWRWVYRRSLLTVPFRKGTLAEDLDWTPGRILAARALAVNEEPFYGYRRGRSGSITSARSEKLIRDVLRINREWIDRTASGVPEHFRRSFLSRCLWNCCSYLPDTAALSDAAARRELEGQFRELSLAAPGDLKAKTRLVLAMLRFPGPRLTGKLLGLLRKS